MSALGRIRSWTRNVIRRSVAEREMYEEMNAHIEQAAKRFVARGMSEHDALRAARREFGNVAVIQEDARDSRGGRWVDNLVTDVRYAFRYFARTPLTTLTILMTMLLAVGGNAALFSVGRGYFFSVPPGMRDDASIVAIRPSVRFEARAHIREMSYSELMDYGRAKAFTGVTGLMLRGAIIDFGDGPEDMFATTLNCVTPNHFSVLGIPIAAGAAFAQSRFDEYRETELTAIVSQTVAETEFGTVAGAIGKTIRLNDVIVTIVGVAAPRFSGVVPGRNGRAIWIPVSALPAIEHSSAALFASPDSTGFYAIGRLSDGVSSSEALSEVRQIAGRNVAALQVATAGRNQRSRRPRSTTDLVRLHPDWRTPTMDNDTIGGLAATVVLDIIVLLVCSTTVSSLLIGSAISRRHEIGVRLSLGASRARIVRQLITESLLLSVVGGVLGLALFAALVRVFASQLYGVDITPTWSAAVFTLVFAMLTSLLCSLTPALHATRHALADVLKDAPTGTTSRSRLQRTFVVAQIALAQPLLVVLATFSALVFTRMGGVTAPEIEDHLVVARMSAFRFAPGQPGHTAPTKSVIERLEGMPGVRAVTPYVFTYGRAEEGVLSPLLRQSQGIANTEQFGVEALAVAPQYFPTVNVAIVKGRPFTDDDPTGRNYPIIVTTKFAEKFLESAEPIGRRFTMARDYGAGAGRDTVTIVGVVNAAQVGGNGGSIYRPLGFTNSLMIRTTVRAETLIPSIRATITREVPALSIESIRSVASLNDDRRTEMLQFSGIAAGGGGITLLLGCVGLYAVVALAVGQRKREIGIRIALGAKPQQVVSMFFKGGLKLSLTGLGIGLPLSAAAMKILMTETGGHTTNMLAVTASVAGLVVAVAALATWFPARRAARVDPAVALRAE